MTKLQNIKRFVDEYGFECVQIHTSEGGSKHITYFGVGTVDIGTVSGMNPGGLGGSDYIRKADDVQRHIAHIDKTVWLNEKEKLSCIVFLQEIEQRANDFLKVRERFDVKKHYQATTPGHNTFTFIEKAPAMTLHTKISIVIEQPSGGEGGWNEGNAWRALYDVLDANKERIVW